MSFDLFPFYFANPYTFRLESNLSHLSTFRRQSVFFLTDDLYVNVFTVMAWENADKSKTGASKDIIKIGWLDCCVFFVNSTVHLDGNIREG